MGRHGISGDGKHGEKKLLNITLASEMHGI